MESMNICVLYHQILFDCYSTVMITLAGRWEMGLYYIYYYSIIIIYIYIGLWPCMGGSGDSLRQCMLVKDCL